MPPADVRADQAKRDETATWTKEALSTNMWQIIAHPIVHAAIGGAFVACECCIYGVICFFVFRSQFYEGVNENNPFLFFSNSFFTTVLLYQIVMIYKPIYRTYGEVCTTGGHSVATSGGTILTEV